MGGICSYRCLSWVHPTSSQHKSVWTQAEHKSLIGFRSQGPELGIGEYLSGHGVEESSRVKSHGYSPSVYIVRGTRSSVVETELAHQYPGSRFSPSLAVKNNSIGQILDWEKESNWIRKPSPVNELIYRRARLRWARKDGGQICLIWQGSPNC